MKRKEAQKKIRDACENGNISFVKHFSERLKERGIDYFDCLNILKKGKIKGQPRKDDRTKLWRCVVIGKTLDIPKRKTIKIIIEFDNEKYLKLITAYPLEGKL